ncbi:MAG: hypothetical protein IKZ13_02690 [Akkermansia sp.]|nr:hypothetical protein [Akkermansia sp.]
MTAAEKALSTFREPPYMYNCAQTICAAFNRDDLLEPMKACGGGRAPEGMCGALYGAIQVAPERAEELKAAFIEKNGAWKCCDLKGGAQRVACQQCVAVAAQLVSSEEA